MQEMVDNVHEHFIEYVKTSRGDRLRGDESTLFNGRVWTGDEAVKLGIIDGIDHMESYLGKFAGDHEIVEIDKKSSLFDHISKFIPSSSIISTPFKKMNMII